jgi:hypothetical protein
MLKRYLLFQFDSYDPIGGWADFQGDFDTLEEAAKYINSNSTYDFDQIIDSHTGKEV